MATPSKQKPGSYFEESTRKNLEVVFPGQFTQVHPWNKMPDKSELVPNLDVIVRVDILTHVTHNAEAKKIIRKEYKFRAQAKFGKDVGESYRLAPISEDQDLHFDQEPGPTSDDEHLYYDLESGPTSENLFYDPIPPRSAVFPGCYSWWGISSKWSNNFEIKEYVGEEYVCVYVPDYLKSTPESRYGNNAFSSKFSDLLTAYARSRCTEVGNICIRVGGTLHYRYEICYVLIICTDSSMDVQALSEFKPLPTTESELLFKTNGLINESGKVIDHSAILTFHPEYIYSWVNGDSYSYETTTFAFYFPEESSMQLDSDNCSYNDGVKHESKYCVKKQPNKSKQWVCPNM
jgi:hypothetical protein